MTMCICKRVGTNNDTLDGMLEVAVPFVFVSSAAVGLVVEFSLSGGRIESITMTAVVDGRNQAQRLFRMDNVFPLCAQICVTEALQNYPQNSVCTVKKFRER